MHTQIRMICWGYQCPIILNGAELSLTDMQEIKDNYKSVIDQINQHKQNYAASKLDKSLLATEEQKADYKNFLDSLPA